MCVLLSRTVFWDSVASVYETEKQSASVKRCFVRSNRPLNTDLRKQLYTVDSLDIVSSEAVGYLPQRPFEILRPRRSFKNMTRAFKLMFGLLVTCGVVRNNPWCTLCYFQVLYIL